MIYPFDLHLHSNFSPDATDSIQKIIRLAKVKKIKGLVVTDHNLVHGIKPVTSAIKRSGLQTFEGLEIYSRYLDIDLHLLGYARNFNLNWLEKKLRPTIAGYNLRAKKMLALCQKGGLIDPKIKFDRLLKEKKTLYVSTRDIHLLISSWLKIPYQEAKKMTAFGTRFHVRMSKSGIIPIPQASRIIHEAGGISVLAHPYYVRKSPVGGRDPKGCLEKIITGGQLDGIEVNYPAHTADDKKLFLSLAKKYRLLTTGGSDWHGKTFSLNELGSQGVSRADWELFGKRLK